MTIDNPVHSRNHEERGIRILEQSSFVFYINLGFVIKCEKMTGTCPPPGKETINKAWRGSFYHLMKCLPNTNYFLFNNIESIQILALGGSDVGQIYTVN